MNFNLDKLIHTGTFLDNAVHEDWLREHCDDVTGEDVRMYYFYQHDFTVSFVCNKSGQVLCEQAEIPRAPDSGELTDYDRFIKKYDALITDIYRDEVETVVFMKRGVNAHFNEVLIKITSGSEASRTLVVSTMNKIR